MNSVLLTKNQLLLLILFISSVLSRILSSIYYIEDIDSLRFALSLYDYNLLNLQPHFPGYPVFCFFAKIFYSIVPSMGISFSIIGGISTFVIIYYSLRLGNTDIKSPEGFIMSLIIFFNPMVWLMGNRYMPDLMGFALALSILYFFILPQTKSENIFVGFFLTGILFGTRLSYFPLVIIPFFKNLQEGLRLKKITFLILGIAVWLIPLILMEGFNNLILSAKKQTIGHFTDFGGTAITENNWVNRLVYTIESIWSDGLGGYWVARSWHTMFVSLFLVILISIGIYTIAKNWKHEKYLRRIIRSVALYFIWILLFQNVIYKSRHILPVLLLFFIVLAIGVEFIFSRKSKILNIISVFFVMSLAQITINLAIDHKKPAAVTQLKDYLLNNKNFNVIISTPLINFYLKTHNIDVQYVNVFNNNDLSMLNQNRPGSGIMIIGNFDSLPLDKYQVAKLKTYYHNPYVNRMWSKIQTYTLNLD